MDQSKNIEFDGWTLNRNSGELRDAGCSTRLRPQPLKVLEELLAHPGEVVSRAQLIARLWPKGIVDFDTALNSAVRRLRKGLRDEANAPKYIETIPRRGYRYIGPITPTSAGEAAIVNAVATSTLPDRRAGFSRGFRTVMMACALGAFGVWISIDLPEPPAGAAASARSIVATQTVSKVQVFQFLEMQFAKADRNHDGELDADELAAFVQFVARPNVERH